MKPYADASRIEPRCRPRAKRSRCARSAVSSVCSPCTRWSCARRSSCFGSVWHRTNTEAQLRPKTTSVPRLYRADRGGHRAEPHVEDESSQLDLGAKRGSDGSDNSAMEKHLPFSQCAGVYRTRLTASFICLKHGVMRYRTRERRVPCLAAHTREGDASSKRLSSDQQRRIVHNGHERGQGRLRQA